VLRGHTDEVMAVAISEPAQLIASASKDGDLMLWKDDGKSAADGYSRLPENLRGNEVLPLDHSRLLLLDPGKPPELVDLKGFFSPRSLLGIGSSTNVLGWFGTNILCHWNGTNQILVLELRGAEFIQRGAIALDSGTRPPGLAYNATRQLLEWTEGTSSASVYLASLATPGRRIDLRSDVPGLVPFHFSEDGKYLAAVTVQRNSLRVWNVETGQIVASIGRHNEWIHREDFFGCGPESRLMPNLGVTSVELWSGTDILFMFHSPLPSWLRYSLRHGRNCNIVFCDAHVESMAPSKLFSPTNTSILWNNDHQPHPETWY
jgi:prepilin-type processing-associated H-X9-DG protein